MKHWLIPFAIFIAISESYLLADDMPLDDYGGPTNSVVATPVGYEKRVTLDTGETVRMYPDRLSPEEDAKCRAVLFCILSPDSLRGKYFLLNSVCQCRMCRTYDSVQDIKIGRHYRFDSLNTIANVTEVAFELGQPGGPLTMSRFVGERLYCSTNETDGVLHELAAERRDIPCKIRKLQDELAMLPKPRQLKGKELRKSLHRSWELENRIRELHELLTNSIPDTVERVGKRRDWLVAHGGAVTNRVEPDRLWWNENVRAMAACKLPTLAFRDKTLYEILSGIEQCAISNGVSFACKPEVRFFGNVPNDAKWTCKYNIVLPAGSLLDMWKSVGRLPDVSVRVRRGDDFWWMTYFLPGDSHYVDWGTSVFSSVCPEMELKDVTAHDAMKALYKIQVRNSNTGGNLHIDHSVKGDVRRSFSFTGKTLRAVVSELEQAFDAVYDYNRGDWFNPKLIPILNEKVTLLMCDKSVWGDERTVRNRIVLDEEQVKMLNGMMERCDVERMDFVCCEWFLQNGDPYWTIYYNIMSLGILTDDATKEALGFDLGNHSRDSFFSDSRQPHHVRILRSKNDRRRLYSFLHEAKERMGASRHQVDR
jgi:hypothetical protein